MKIRKEVKIGVFTVVILAMLYLCINFLKGKDLFNRSTTYYAYYDNVSGIQLSAPVIIKGINAGSVRGIKFRPDLDNSVELKLEIRSTYEVPDNSVVRLFSNGLMGGKALEIELGDSPNLLPDGATMLSQSETSILDVAGSELDFFKQRLSELMNSLDAALNGLNSIMTGNSDAIAGTLEGVEKAARALGDSGEDLRDIIDNVNRVTAAFADNSGKIDSTLVSLQSVSANLAEADLAATVARLDSVLDELDTALAAVNSSQGSAGMLINDKELYESLTEASGNLAALLEDLKQNPKRYVHFSLFGGGKDKK